MPYQIKPVLQKSAIFLLGILLAGCASQQPAPMEFVPPVYPPPPDQARFIFERTLLYNDDIEEYTKAMRFKQFATGASRKLRGLVKPFDVAVKEGRVYVTDTVQRAVLLFDIPGKRFVEIGTDKPGELIKPLGIDVTATGDIYVSDVSAQQIVVYDAEGTYIRTIGSKEQLSRPSDVAVSPDGKRVFVVDTGGVESNAHHVHIFDALSGELLKSVGQRGSKEGDFNLPLMAVIGADEKLYVVDGGNFRVQIFSLDGEYLSSFGSVGRFTGQFARPKGISIDPQGNIYVVDTAFGNVQIFNNNGDLLMFLGERGHAGTPGKYMLPAGVDIDGDGRIYLVDQFFRKIDVFRPAELAPTDGYIGMARDSFE